MTRWPLLHVLLVVAIAFALSAAIGGTVSAQQCNSDAQCGPSASGYNVCLGDTLIMRRRLCVGGQCIEQEMGRVSCGGGRIGSSCEGNVYVGGSGSRCDAMSGRCAPGTATRIACVKSCSCLGRTLTISTGTCTGSGCDRTVVRCKIGCTCSGEPRCTEDPTPPRGRGAQDESPDGVPEGGRSAAALRPAQALPPRIAEPFDASARLDATPVPAPAAANGKSTSKAKPKRKRQPDR